MKRSIAEEIYEGIAMIDDRMDPGYEERIVAWIMENYDIEDITAPMLITHDEAIKLRQIANAYGSNWDKMLTELLLHADDDNTMKILKTWPENIAKLRGFLKKVSE